MSSSLAWVTPFSADSDISAFSHGLLLEFCRLAESLHFHVSIFVQENGPRFWSQLPLIPLTGTAVDREILLSYDFVVFNIGNSLSNHEFINRLALDVPGVVIVHDLVMHHAVAGMLQLGERDNKRGDVYALLMGEYYGMAGLDVVSESRLCAGGEPVYAPWDTPQVSSFPLVEPFVNTAAAVVVHSAYAQAAITLPAGTPLLRLQLPWDQKPCPSQAALEDWARRTALRKPCSLVCIGHIGRGKCLDLVILAFAQSPLLRGTARLTIAGHPGDDTYLAELRRLVAQFGLRDRVEFLLSVSDEQLQDIKLKADIFVNLRYPNTEGAPGSLVEQLAAGKPVVVYPAGAYGEVDENAVIRIDRAEGLPGLVMALEGAVLDPQARVRIGAAGRAFVRQLGRQDYVRKLWSFLCANRDLLRARKSCAAGRRSLPAVSEKAVGKQWLTGLNRARRLFLPLGSGPFELDVLPFLEWSDDALAVYVAVGVFGQAPGSKLETVLRAGLSKAPWADWYEAVAQAHVVWRASESPAPLTSELRHCLEKPLLLPRAWLLLAALGRWSLARCCYTGLLGRAPEVDHIAFHVACSASSTVSGLLNGFLASQEFARRQAPPEGVRALRSWFERDDFPMDDFAILPPDDTVAFTTANPGCARYFGPGWHVPEPHGTWSSTAAATLLFGIRSPNARLILTVTGRVMDHNVAGRRFSLRLNGSDALASQVSAAGDVTVSLAIEPAPDEPAMFALAFDCGGTISPRAAGCGEDNRQLGFCLMRVTLSDVAKAVAP